MKKADKKTTIYDLAKALGTSPSTVSAALNGTWKSRRISEKKALQIQDAAREQGYYINMQARGLRSAKSGMVGMLVPQHNSRFFASMAQEFDHCAKARNLCPVVIATERETADELKTVETLISFSVDALFTAGATNPDAISHLCQQAAIPHINIDLPGTKAPSVITDNYSGATRLVTALHQRAAKAGLHGDGIIFIGGNPQDYATSERIRGFHDAIKDLFTGDCPVYAEGYLPEQARETANRVFSSLAKPPSALFINSVTVFEGIIQYMQEHRDHPLQHTAIGCFDYHPFLAYMPFEVVMVKQNVEEMVRTAFEIWESDRPANTLVRIEPELVGVGG